MDGVQCKESRKQASFMKQSSGRTVNVKVKVKYLVEAIKLLSTVREASRALQPGEDPASLKQKARLRTPR
jgi:hypothetical protein